MRMGTGTGWRRATHKASDGSAGEHRAGVASPQVELGEVDRALAPDQPHGHHVDVEAPEHVAEQFVGERAGRRDPAQGVGEGHRVGQGRSRRTAGGAVTRSRGGGPSGVGWGGPR